MYQPLKKQAFIIWQFWIQDQTLGASPGHIFHRLWQCSHGVILFEGANVCPKILVLNLEMKLDDCVKNGSKWIRMRAWDGLHLLLRPPSSCQNSNCPKALHRSAPVAAMLHPNAFFGLATNITNSNFDWGVTENITIQEIHRNTPVLLQLLTFCQNIRTTQMRLLRYCAAFWCFLWDVLGGLSRVAGTSGNPHSAETLLLRKDVEIAFPV